MVGRAEGCSCRARDRGVVDVKVQLRPAGAWELSRRKGLYRRLTLRRADGRVYLNRWGIGHDRIGGVLLHRMDAPDPGKDLHDHPWWFCSIIVSGGYRELRAPIRCPQAKVGVLRRPGSVRTMRLDECHIITDLWRRDRSWSLVIKGPRRRGLGFYPSSGYMPEAQYDATIRADRRDLRIE